MVSIRNPLLPACFLHWTETDHTDGEDVLRLMSWRRTLTLKGSAFETFEHKVIPLLDGSRSVDEICSTVADVFSADEVIAALNTLSAQGIIVEGATEISDDARASQMGWLSENAPQGRAAQHALRDAHVVIFGLGSCGAAVARSMRASGIGRLTLVDPAKVLATDPYFSPLYRSGDVGKDRVAVLQNTLCREVTDQQIISVADRPANTEAIVPLIEDATLVLCCLESGELNLALLLNLACHTTKTPWMAATLEGTELVIGPGFFHSPGGPCYQCWRMREMAVAPNPQTRLSIETELARRQADLSGQRENLAAAADIAGGMLAAEAVTWLTGAAPPSLDGRFITLTVPGLRIEKHAVLRKPGCPVCQP